MKTTINLPDEVVRKLKREAAARGETMSTLVEAAAGQQHEHVRARVLQLPMTPERVKATIAQA